jgi:hypothetical protein
MTLFPTLFMRTLSGFFLGSKLYTCFEFIYLALQYNIKRF